MYTVVLQWCIGLHYTAHDIHYNQVRIHSGGAQRERAPKTHGIFFTREDEFLFLPPFATSLYNNSPLFFSGVEHGARFVAFSGITL